MPYIDPALVKVSTLEIAGGVLLAFSTDEYSVPRLVVKDGLIEIHLAGESVGHGYRPESDETIAYVEHVYIEVDTESVRRPTVKVPLQIVRQGEALGVFYRSVAFGRMTQTNIADITGSVSPSQAHDRIAFSRWRICIGEGRDKVVLLDVDTDRDEFTVKQQR